MSIGIKVARFIAMVGAYERSFVVRTVFDHRMIWVCRVCGYFHSGRFVTEHKNPYPTSCYKCGVGHVVCIGGREWN